MFKSWSRLICLLVLIASFPIKASLTTKALSALALFYAGYMTGKDSETAPCPSYLIKEVWKKSGAANYCKNLREKYEQENKLSKAEQLVQAVKEVVPVSPLEEFSENQQKRDAKNPE